MENGYSEYEAKTISEIARHSVGSNAVMELLETSGKPFDVILKHSANSSFEVLKDAFPFIQDVLNRALVRTIQFSKSTYDENKTFEKFRQMGIDVDCNDDIMKQPLEKMDSAADSFALSDEVIIGLEGAMLNTSHSLSEYVPYGQFAIPSLMVADISASMTLLSKQVALIGSCYGYPPTENKNIPHIVASMALHSFSADHRPISSKLLAEKSITETDLFLDKNSGKAMTLEFIENDAPKLVQLMNYVAERLGIVVHQKELGMLVPVPNTFLEGSVNVAFQCFGHTNAKDYFRALSMSDKYGDEKVACTIFMEIQKQQFAS